MENDSGLSRELRSSLQQHRTNADRSGDLVLGAQEGHVGDTVAVRGINLPASTKLSLHWQTLDGSWGVLSANEVLGPQYKRDTRQLKTVETDDEGRFTDTIDVPEDYGSSHTVELRDGADVLAQSEFEIFPHFELLNDTAQMGEFFTVRGYGIGPNPVRNNFQLSWDLGTVGFMTGVKNGGTATASVRAVGPPGTHNLRVWRSYKGFPFLQSETQSEFGPVGRESQSGWDVEVTEPESPPATAWTEDRPDENPIQLHYPSLDAETEAELSITPSSGPPGTQAIIRGKEFPPNEVVDLVWHRHSGKRIDGNKITPNPQRDKLPSVETDDDGKFQLDVEIPSDRGSSRPITAEVGGESVAITGFMMKPTITEFSPQSGPRGTEIDIKIAGTGWTLYENTNFLVYDNKMLGYFCGNSDSGKDGVVHLNFEAAGEPGYHFIDVYPTIFETKEGGTGFECKPHLSYLDNHPVRPLPAHHFTFEITE